MMLVDLLDKLQREMPLLEWGFRILETKIPSPVPTRIGSHTYPRYKEKSAEQAALQKIARYISGLHALVILLRHRHLQEDGTLKRTLDELDDDVMFLLMQPQSEKELALHKRFLDGFYAEEFDEGVSPMDSKRKRKRTLRREVRDYIHARTSSLCALGAKASEVLYQGYSGYVHADSPHLMEMWDWHSQLYELDGIKDSDLFQSHVADATNYFARGFYNLASLASRLDEPNAYAALKLRGDQLADLAAKL